MPHALPYPAPDQRLLDVYSNLPRRARLQVLRRGRLLELDAVLTQRQVGPELR